jgi:hypothetical protein
VAGRRSARFWVEVVELVLEGAAHRLEAFAPDSLRVVALDLAIEERPVLDVREADPVG